MKIKVPQAVTNGAVAVALGLATFAVIDTPPTDEEPILEEAPSDAPIETGDDDDVGTNTWLFLYEYTAVDTIGGDGRPSYVVENDKTSFFRFKWPKGKPIDLQQVTKENLDEDQISSMTRFAIHP